MRLQLRDFHGVRPVEISTGGISSLRRIEALSSERRLYALLIFLISTVLMVLARVLGPRTMRSVRFPFELTKDSSRVQKFSVKAGDFSHFNKYLTLGMELATKKPINASSLVPSISLVAKSHFDKGIEDLATLPAGPKTFHFEPPYTQSDTVTLFETPITEFKAIESQITVHFQKRHPFSGNIVCSYTDVSFSVMQVLLRIVLFGINLGMTFALTRVPSSIVANPKAFQVLKLVGIGMTTLNNPLLQFFDLTANSKVASATFVTDVAYVYAIIWGITMLLDLPRYKETNLMNWIIFEAIPFVTLLALRLVCVSIFAFRLDDIRLKTPVFLPLIEGLVCIARVLYSILRFQSEVKYERLIFAALLGAASFVTITDRVLERTARFWTGEPVGVLVMISFSLIVYFVVFFQWPVDPLVGEGTD